MDIDEIIQLLTHQIYNEMPMDWDRDKDSDLPVGDKGPPPTVSLPLRFISVKHHLHANKPNKIIPLDSSTSTSLAPVSEDDVHSLCSDPL